MKKHGLVGALLVLGVGCDMVLGIEQPTSVQNTECRTWRCDEKPCHYEYAAQYFPCSGGMCNGAGECRLPRAATCNDSAQCASGHCSDGVCCDRACGGMCQRCSAAGECVALPRGAYDFDSCGLTEVCDGAGSCKKATGWPCGLDGALCASGYCVDGVCCNTACTESCKACNLAGSQGICSNLPAGQTDTYPALACITENKQTCNGSGVCLGEIGASCSTKDDCRSGHCADGYCCNEECDNACTACNLPGSEGTCGYVLPGQSDASPAGACTALGKSCDGKGNCASNDGQACINHGNCVSGHCVDGVCCDKACNGACEACSAAIKGQGVDGVCEPVAWGLNPGNECGVGRACDGNGLCKSSNGQPCIAGTECLGNTCDQTSSPRVCVGRSCDGLPATCGYWNKHSCCASATQAGATYNRQNQPNLPATVGTVRMDRFEVTVGRFRKFVEAYPLNKPAEGAGAPHTFPDRGWQSAWNPQLPDKQSDLMNELKACDVPTWTDTSGPNEKLPINCVSWYVAFAFCAWDGGRLPTEAEWNLVATRGSLQYVYLWDKTGNSIQSYHAAYQCQENFDSTTCTLADIVPVGMKIGGAVNSNLHIDISGNVAEWTLDRDGSPPVPCIDCANLTDGLGHVRRGGSWRTGFNNGDYRDLKSTFRTESHQPDTSGIRCVAR